MSGYFYERLSTGTKDTVLPARLSSAKEKKRSRSCSAIWSASPAKSRSARERASHDTGIPVDHIAVTGTHTHTGPLYFSSLHDEFHELAAKAHGTDPYDSAPTAPSSSIKSPTPSSKPTPPSRRSS